MTFVRRLLHVLKIARDFTPTSNGDLYQMSYALSQFHRALQALEGDEEQRKQWLESSYMLQILHLQDHDFPRHLSEEFTNFKRDLTRIRGVELDGTLTATVSAMSDAEIARMIERIFGLYKALKLEESVTELK
jgi:hypothetical protein